jgi:hypothetical protein
VTICWSLTRQTSSSNDIEWDSTLYGDSAPGSGENFAGRALVANPAISLAAGGGRVLCCSADSRDELLTWRVHFERIDDPLVAMDFFTVLHVFFVDQQRSARSPLRGRDRASHRIVDSSAMSGGISRRAKYSGISSGIGTLRSIPTVLECRSTT